MTKTKFDFDKELKIEYRVGKDKMRIPNSDNIKVKFSTDVFKKFEDGIEEEREYIFINIIDEDSWI